jgi:hypothetical protein
MNGESCLLVPVNEGAAVWVVDPRKVDAACAASLVVGEVPKRDSIALYKFE